MASNEEIKPLTQISDYQSNYVADYGFEGVLVHYRQRLTIERLTLHKPAVVVEIGCGADMLYGAWRRAGHSVERWVVVEPAEQFAKMARESALPNLTVIEAFFEDALPDLRAALPRSPDFVICAGVLQEVPSSAALLGAVRDCMGQTSVLHVSVANAASLHRRLAQSMGLIADLKAMSQRNLKFQQREVYDMASLTADLASNGFVPCASGGHFIKPFTHDQMAAIEPIIGSPVLDGMYELGKGLVDLASEIYVKARLIGM